MKRFREAPGPFFCHRCEAAFAQPCPEKNVLYWQAFPPGG